MHGPLDAPAAVAGASCASVLLTKQTRSNALPPFSSSHAKCPIHIMLQQTGHRHLCVPAGASYAVAVLTGCCAVDSSASSSSSSPRAACATSVAILTVQQYCRSTVTVTITWLRTHRARVSILSVLPWQAIFAILPICSILAGGTILAWSTLGPSRTCVHVQIVSS